MSQYLNVFVRTDSHEYIELWSYSRNTRMYSFFNEYVPFEKVTQLTEKIFDSVKLDIGHDINVYQKQADKYRTILNTTGLTMEEKLDLVDDIADMDEAINEIKRCYVELCMMYNMEMPVFMGIEACNVTDEDIQ